jgi:hypothetical protein
MMPDFRVAETAPEHPKLRAAGLAAAGLWSLAGGYAMRELTDGWVPDYWVKSWPSGKKHAATLVKVGLWTLAERNGAPGYEFHDWTDYQRTAEQIAAASTAAVTRRAVYADPDLVAYVRGRDQDHCRYCGRPVNWRDRRGARGGTYDHVIPLGRKGGDNAPSNVVVACRGCNAGKRDRTPDEAGMRLLPPPTDQKETRSELGPTTGSNQIGSEPPNPGPFPGPPSGSVGEGSSGTERVAPRNAPRPRCPEHAELPPDQRTPSCGACKRLRLEAEQQAADQAERDAADRAARRALIDACAECDDAGMRDFGAVGVGRCTHPGVTAVAS